MNLYNQCFRVALVIILCAGHSASVMAHGYIMSPPGRAYLCQQGVNQACGSEKYEPQSLEGLKGFPSGGPRDGHIASADKSQFYTLDQQSPARWAKKSVVSGKMTFVWQLKAQHSTAQWRYFITRQGWNSAMPLTRNAFDPTPFCQFVTNGQIPATPVTHHCVLPTDRHGYHVILGVWDIADTANAFYQVVDVNIH